MDAAPPLSLLLLLFVTSGEWSTVEAVTAAQKAAVRSAILKNYDVGLPPTGDQVDVRVFIHILNIDLYAYSKMMTIDSIMYLSWTDSRLSWTGSEVNNVYIYTDEIWVPDIGIVHRWADLPGSFSLPTTKCVVSSEGLVECMPPAEFGSHCQQDYSRWPFSQHNCTLRLGSSLPIEKLKFYLMEVGFDLEIASSNWDNLIATGSTEEVEGKSNVVVTFQLKRSNLLQVAAFISPAIVLVLLTVSPWLLPSDSDERLLLATLSVFLHCIVIDSLGYAMPEQGVKAPQVLLMYRDLLVVSCASFVAAVVLRRLSSLRALDTPVWLPALLETAPARFLLCSPHGSLRLQEDDAEGLVSEEEAASAATPPPAALLALLMNRLGLLASTATCVAALSIRLSA